MVKNRRDDGKDEDAALWRKVAATVTPVSGGKSKTRRASAADKAAVKDAAGSAGNNKKVIRPPAAKAVLPKPVPSSGPRAGDREIDAATRRRLERGQLEPEAQLDLHGMTQAEAQDALPRFIAGSARRGLRNVLVITGKSGILRRRTPEWLDEMPALVLAFAPDKRRGGGALHVRLRR